MKSAIFAALLMAAASLQAMPASAQTFTPAPGRTFSLDLDTAAGNYSAWNMTDLAEVNAVRLKLAMRRVGEHKEYPAAFWVAVANGEDSARLFATAKGRRGHEVLMLFIETRIAGKTGHEIFLTHMEVDEVVDLAVDWTPEGKLRFALISKATRSINGAAETHVADIGKRPLVFTISNATSQLEVLELSAGGYAP